MDERIKMVTQLNNGFRAHVARIAENAAQVATGRFQWLSDDEEEREATAGSARSTFGPKEPIDGVIDVNSVREQLQGLSVELCATDDFHTFENIITSNFLHDAENSVGSCWL